MKIEEAIQQKKFSSEFHKAIINILYTANHFNLYHTKILKPHGISPEQFNLLRILRGQHPKPASIKLLIERMLNKSSNASRLVEKLRTKKLVERKEMPGNRRTVDVKITEKGLALLNELDQNGFDYEIQNQLTEDELATLNNLLDKIREIA